MTESELITLLEAHGVRVTANRMLIVRALDSAGRPLSLGELEDALESIDKSVVFRSLQQFRDSGLVHVLDDSGDGTRYELCHSHGDHDDDLHVHFYCERCHRTFCLEDVPVPSVPVPSGFLAHTSSHLLRGLCPSCARRS